MQPLSLIHGDVLVPVDVLNDHLGNFRRLILDQLALGIKRIPACAGGSVVIHAQRQCATFFQLLALIQHGRDPVADWPANVHRHFQAGEIVKVIVLDNGLEEALPHLQLPGPVQCKVFRAPFQPGFQNPAIYLKRLQRVGEHIGGDHVPDGDLLIEALHHVGKAGDG